MAERIAKMPPLALSAIKRVIQQGQDLPLSAALALERKEFEQLFDSDDQEEGMRAFIEKRDPDFRGK
jgi:enoyl-CoA hydratase/carnithine racemase